MELTKGRRSSFGQNYSPTLVDRYGVWLSARMIRRHVRDFTGKRIGDFGCGYNATFVRSIINDAAGAVLIDVAIAPDLKGMEKVSVLEGDLVERVKEIPDGSLDVILCISALEHLWDPESIVSEFRRILAAGGVCLLNVPTWRGKFFLEFSAFRLGLSPKAEMDDHKMYYDKRDLWPLLVRAGFRPSELAGRYHKFGLNLFFAASKGVE